MGCCSSSSNAPIPQTVQNVQVFGVVYTMSVGRYFEKAEAAPNTEGSIIKQPEGARLPNPSQQHQAGKTVPHQGLELAFNWAAGRGGQARVSVGMDKWRKGDSAWFNSALLSNEFMTLRCGREEVLFAGVVGAKPPEPKVGLVVLSTGMVLVLSKKTPVVKTAYHTFDLKKLSAAPLGAAPQGEQWEVSMEFGDRFPGAGGSQMKNTVCNLETTKSQAIDLVTAFRLLSLAYFSVPMSAQVPEDFIKKITMPSVPCDGGFLARYFATCAYFGLNLRTLTIGGKYFASVPLLELDLSEFGPSWQPGMAKAVRFAVEHGFGFRAFVCRDNPMSDAVFTELLPIFKLGTIMKVHMPNCGLSEQSTDAFAKALSGNNANYVVDYDFSGDAFSQAGAASLADAVELAQGGLRCLLLANCGIDGSAGNRLLQAIGKKCSKLQKLSLTGNDLGIQPDPHPLTPIWDAPLEVLEIGGTGMELAKIVDGVDAKKVSSLRELDVSGLSFPVPAVVEKFFGALGPRLERIGIADFGRSDQDLALVLSALGRIPKPALQVDLSSTSPDVALSGLVIASSKGALPKGGIRLGPIGDPVAIARLYSEMQQTVVTTYAKAKQQGLKGAAQHAQVAGQLPGIMQQRASDQADYWLRAQKAMPSVATLRLQIAPRNSVAEGLQMVLVAGDEPIMAPVGSPPPARGAGPSAALLLPGLGENKSILELDLTDCIGGDAMGVMVGMALKTNRTIRSVKVVGNYITHLGLKAIRGSLYGNMKLVEFPWPEADCSVYLAAYQKKQQELNNEVMSAKREIKAAFKRTKGARTPQVLSTLNACVARISSAKGTMARLRIAAENFAKVQQEIQEAINRNQKDTKNLQANAKLQQASWKEADKAMSNIDRLTQQQATMKSSEESELWKKRQAIAQVWSTKIRELQGKKKDVQWYFNWEKANTKKEGGLVVTGEAAEGLLKIIPRELVSALKEEVKKTKEFIKTEDKVSAQMRSLDSKIQQQKLEVARLQASPNWAKPPTSGQRGLSNQHAQQLQQPVIVGSVVPPPGIVQGKVVQVCDDGPWGADPDGPRQPVTGTVVGVVNAQNAVAINTTPVVAVVPASGAQNAAQYDQWQVYQQQQVLYSQQFNGRVSGQKQQQTPCLPPRRQDNRNYNDGYYGGSGGDAAFMGMYMYNWHHLHLHNRYSCYHHHHYYYHDPYYYGGYHDHYHYDNNCHMQDNCGWVQQNAEPPVNQELGMDGAPPEGFAADGAGAPSDAQEAGQALGMYAGGEDDRPGKGPHGGSGSHAAKAWYPIPARLDVLEYFEKGLAEADQAAKEAVLGRIGPLPCRRELLVKTGGEEVAGVCLVTQCSLDRLDRLAQQMESWEGEVAVAVYVEAPPESLAAVRARQSVLEACGRVAASREAAGRAEPPLWTIVAVYELEESEVRVNAYDKLYPVNTLRNAALEVARADLVFLLDVDFVPSAGLHSMLCGEDGGRRLGEALRPGAHRPPTALVVPAFEGAFRESDLPREGHGLREAEAAGEVEAFHVGHFPKGHRATNFERWLRGSPLPGAPPALGRLLRSVDGVDAFPIDYEEHFEPYIVAVRSLVPAYDERFRGYGLNKISHLYSVHAHGFRFCTVDHGDAFVVAAKHPKSKSWRACVGPDAEAEQSARISMHYASFKEELRSKLPYRSSAAPARPLPAPRAEAEGTVDAAGEPAVPALWLRPAACASSAEDLLALLRIEAPALAGPCNAPAAA